MSVFRLVRFPALAILLGCCLASVAFAADEAVETSQPPLQLFATGLAGHSAMCCDGNGNVLVTNYRHLGSVGKISTELGALVLWDAPKANADQEEPFPLVGLAIDDDQRVLTLDAEHGRLLRWNPETKMVGILADRYQGRRFDSLFAVDVGPGGNIYFTEPERSSGDGANGALYRFDVATNRPQLLADSLHLPTGMVLSSDGKSLLVAESAQARIAVFQLKDDAPAEKVATYFLTVMLDVDNAKEIGRLGHVTLDRRGWLYVALWDRGEIAVIDTTSGKLLELIPCGSDRVFGLTLWQDALLMSIPSKEAIYRYDLRPLIGRHAP
ncbi:SMP-30/gluconolactonase/LRE family protein [Bremerella sp. JC817]|uniref:SMP-30/gluconolactonase/LRE family protein n=1 Tax=Bremerella sp. JC817 TaxID=3231756 RepID=UPI00345A24F8